TVTVPATSTARTAKAATAPPSPTELEKAFASFDINADAQLDGIEVTRCACAVADSNGDGEITKAEYLAAGLLGKLRPARVEPSPTTPPGPTTPVPPTPAPPAPPAPAPPVPPAPAGGGITPGTYNCFGTVGGFYGKRGSFTIVDGSRYTSGSTPGSYDFTPATKAIRFTSGLYADPTLVKSAAQTGPTAIVMRTGKDGFTRWECGLNKR
ncbi:MAG TPA: hypothetical protein VM925_01595, partial [Labilithrix sp.]|nr:hypothetical protein [Labilithrix sp.]